MPKSSAREDLPAYTVHMIGNAHIDPVWQWRWEEGRQEVLDTCRAALDRFRETPAFVFCRSSAVTYQWIEEQDPEMFAEIKRLIARGHWCIVNGWWVQPDCNLPGGESLVRQGLYGQRYFMEKFGCIARTGYNVDTFGHAWTLPQILAGQGMNQYCFFRPGAHEKDLPGTLFWWEGPDGTRVLTARMPGHYCTWAEDIRDRIDGALAGTPKGMHDTMCFYGVGNHGGGPTKRNIESILEADADPDGPKVIFSTPDAFFDAVRERAEKCPVVAEELQYHARGCYAAVSDLKSHNRLSENMLVQAEKLACLAGELTGAPYPAADLDCAWKKVLFNQFHDIMAGTSIRPACDDAITDYHEAQMLAGRAIRTAMTSVSSRIDCPGEGRPIVVYNTLSWERTEVVETEVTWTNRNDDVYLVDEVGEPVPHQIVHTNISGRGATIRLVFLARAPACGYRTYRMLQGPEPNPAGETPFSVGATFVDSDLFRVEFDPETGHMTRILDKSSGADLLSAPGNVPLVIDDPSDTWSHDIASFRDEIDHFEATDGIRIAEVGPVRARVLVEMEAGDSTLVQDIRLYRGVSRIDVFASVDYHGEHEFLKIAFPTALSEVTATCEVPYGFTTRLPNGEEQPAQKWADVTGHTGDGTVAGLAVLNDSRYGYDVLDGEIRLSVLRTPIYCFHDPDQVDGRKRYEFTDQGERSFTYSLVPHGSDWREGDVLRQAQQLNHPCLVREEPAHSGVLAARLSFAECDADNVIVEVIKRAEEGGGTIVRAYETHGREASATIVVNKVRSGPLSFRPCEIKTLLVSHGLMVETDLLENVRE